VCLIPIPVRGVGAFLPTDRSVAIAHAGPSDPKRGGWSRTARSGIRTPRQPIARLKRPVWQDCSPRHRWDSTEGAFHCPGATKGKARTEDPVAVAMAPTRRVEGGIE
jgi:hypothetical protein